MRKIILFTILIGFAGYVYAQQPYLEELLKQIENANEDTLKVNLLLDLSNFYRNNSKPDSALLLANQGLELAKLLDYKQGEISGIRSVASRSWGQGDFSTAIKFGYSLLEIAKNLNDSSILTSSYSILSRSYRDQGDYNEGLKFALKRLDIEKAEKDTAYFGVANADIASNYYGMEKYDSASYYLKIALSHPKGNVYYWILLMKARTEAKLKNYDVAFDYYHQSIKQRPSKSTSKKDLAGAYAGIAALFDEVAQTDSTIFYGKLAVNIAKHNNYNKELFEAYLILSKAYEKISTEESLNYYKLAMDEKDNLFNQEKQRQITSYKFNEVLRQNEIESAEQRYKNNIRTNTMAGSLFTLSIIAILLFISFRRKQKAKQKIEKAYSDLKSTQSQLIQSEKMASLGELTAGIAHEIQNPLNFVNNFSEVNKEMMEELHEEIKNGNLDEVKEIAKDVIENEQKINHHGKRAEAIVKGMLQHSRTSTGEKELTDINALADEYLRLSYHGLRAKDKSFNADFKTEFDESLPKINVVPQDIGRVLLNLINNAFYAAPLPPKGGYKDPNYIHKPTVIVKTSYLHPSGASPDKSGGQRGAAVVSVTDNGHGIPPEIKDKIFQPFFTTKPTGSGTGLGLSLSYDIVKAHGGELSVNSEIQKGTEFIIVIPT